MFPAYHKSLIFRKGFKIMLLLYKNIKNRPSVFLSLAGLTGAGFKSLLPLFGKADDDYTGDT